MNDDSGSFDRLERALEIFSEWEDSGRPSSPQELLTAHPDLREVLEPLVEEEGEAESPMTDDEVPDELGGFRIEHEIGRGGMGVVYAARQVALDRPVALKVLPSGSQISPRAVARFRRESALLASLSHPGLVEVLTVGREQGFEYFAMELIDGVPLNKILRELSRDANDSLDESRWGSTVQELLDQSQLRFYRAQSKTETRTSTSTASRSYFESIARIAHQTAQALHHAHEAGVLHRDVKPSNILIRANGQAVLTDFGLAREAGRPSLTQSGEFAGTPYYSSPEQVVGRSQDLDPRSDVFSLGVVLYELATLKRPFEGANSHEVAQAVVTEEPEDPSRVHRRVPDDLAAITLKALDKSPGRRYQTAAEFAADLDAFLHRRPVRARKAGAVRKLYRFCRRAPLKASLIAVLGVSVPAIGFLSGFLIAEQDAVAAGEAEILARRVDGILEQVAMIGETRRPEVVPLLDEALRLDPDNPEAFGMRLIETARGEAAETALESIRSREPDGRITQSALDRLEVALLQRLGRSEEAAALEQDLGDPRTAVEAFFQGTVALFRGHEQGSKEAYVEAMRAFDLAILLSPRRRPIYHYQLAHSAGHAQVRTRSLAIAHALEANWPESPNTFWWRWFVLRGFDNARAEQALRRGIEIAPDNRFLPYSLGGLLNEAGRLEEALEQYERATELDPRHDQALANLGGVLIRLERFEEGIAAYDRAIAIDPVRALFHMNKAQALISLRRFDEAESAVTKALDLDPQDENSLQAMARLIGMRDGPMASRAFCEEQIDAGRDPALLYWMLARTCRMVNEPDAALEAATLGAERHPNSSRLHIMRGELLQRSDPEASLEALETAARLAPESAQLWQIIGRMRLRADEPEAAVTAFRTRLKLVPTDKVTYIDLSYAQKRAGQLDDALQTLDAALERFPGDEKLLAERAKLQGLQKSDGQK